MKKRILHRIWAGKDQPLIRPKTNKQTKNTSSYFFEAMQIQKKHEARRLGVLPDGSSSRKYTQCHECITW